MKVFAYAATGFAGRLVSVEVDIRRGIPGLDIVGLPDGAVRESRERVRVALRRNGYEFPSDRILVNLSPADLRKEGASYDLPIAVGILSASGQIPADQIASVLCAGELMLDGTVCAVRGILPAVAAAQAVGIHHFIVPLANLREANTLPGGRVFGLDHIRNLPQTLSADGPVPRLVDESKIKTQESTGIPRQDMADLRGQPILRRALEVAAAGGHHLLIFGPPGSGKTMGARALEGLLPDLSPETAIEVTRIWSQAGYLDPQAGLILRPPFREPHHSASAQGLVGGGVSFRPGEASLAHGGVLFLDEAPEFGAKVLQSLREPLESRRIDLARAGRTWWFPSDFLLLMAMNPCPCGNMGREEASCLCTPPEVSRYWRRLGGALLDRVDIRVPISPVAPEKLIEPPGEATKDIRNRVELARQRQKDRHMGHPWECNADIPPGELEGRINMDGESSSYFTEAVRRLGLSSRAAHGILRVSRTLADLDGRDGVVASDILEAVQHRRYGDRDLFWFTL